MGLKEKIHSVNKEASLYKSQGMYEEALVKYQELFDLVKSFRTLKNQNSLLDKIKIKINEIEQRLDYYSSNKPSKDVSVGKKEIIKRLFSESTDDPDFNAFEEALTLAKFGQYEDSIKEMARFLKNDKLRIYAARNILRCYRSIGRDKEANRLLREWKIKEIISEKEAKSLASNIIDVEEEIEKAQETQTEISPMDVTSENDSPEIMEINSVGIKLADKESMNNEPVELDVSFQTGNHLSLIISSREKIIIDNLDVGVKLNDMCFYSPIAVFKSSGIVLSKHQIKSGPKKGDWCLDIEIKNPT